MTTAKRIVLFKKHDREDNYAKLLIQQGFQPEFIPVLDHVTTNIDTIRTILLEGPHVWSALILTSHRSVQAMVEAYESIPTNTPMTNSVKTAWNTIPIYLVGPHTAHVLNEWKALFNNTSYWTVAPRALELLPSLLNLPTKNQVLFLAGDKRRDLIPTELKAAGFHVHEVQSYVTCRHRDLTNRLKSLILPCWFVYFSPSGLNYVLTSTDKTNLNNHGFIAAIGPTTAEAITSSLGFDPHVTAKLPDPHHLVEAIVQFESANEKINL